MTHKSNGGENNGLKEAAASKPLPNRLLLIHEVPAHMQEPFVLGSYRPEIRSSLACVGTIFGVHNQSGDIWTHLVATGLYLGLAVYSFTWDPRLAGTTWTEKLVFLVYFLGCLNCFGCSALYHTLVCHSYDVAHAAYLLDNAGIVSGFLGSIVFLSYFGFHCHVAFRWVHLALGIGASLGVYHVVVFGGFRGPQVSGRSWRRLLTSLSMFACGLGSVLHMGYSLEYGESLLRRFFVTYLCYGVGMGFYLSRVPERWLPGKFDLLLKSHQIWHLFVMAGALNFYPLIMECFEHYKANPC